MIEARSRWSRVLLQFAVSIAILPFLYPLVVMIVESTKGQGAAANYAAVLAQPAFFGFLFNSARIAVGVIAISFVGTMLAAYALALLNIRGREVAFYVLVGALTLPSAALIVPLFITVRELGLYNTPWAVILPLAALQTAFNVLLVRGFMEGLPVEVLDAARVDGANSLAILWHIVLPLCRPISAVIIVWSFIAAWNEYLLPLLFLQDVSEQTITLIPTYFVEQYSSDQTKVFAASVIIALPTVLCYIAFQRFFERGLTAGASK